MRSKHESCRWLYLCFAQVLLCHIGLLAAEETGRSSPTTCPKLYLGLTGAKDLEAASPAQWQTVIRRLDGVWFNAAGVPQEAVLRILTNIPGRPVILPVAIRSRAPWSMDDPAIARFEDAAGKKLVGGIEAVVVNCDSAKKLGNGDWQIGDIEKCRAQYLGRAKKIYMVVRGSHFNSDHEPVDDIVAHLIEKEADGVAFEISPFKLSQEGVYRMVFQKGWEKARHENKPFMWLAPVGMGEGGSYLADMQKAWTWIRKNGIALEYVIPINYGVPDALSGPSEKGGAVRKALPSVPECDGKGEAVNSLTGVVYWLMRQSD